MDPKSALPMDDEAEEADEANEEDREEPDRDDVRLVAARKALDVVLTPDRLPPEEPLELPVSRAGVLEEELRDDPAVDCTVDSEAVDEEEPEEPPPPDLPPRPRPLRLPRIIGAIRDTYFSAAVTPVRRSVRSIRAEATATVGTVRTAFVAVLLPPAWRHHARPTLAASTAAMPASMRRRRERRPDASGDVPGDTGSVCGAREGAGDPLSRDCIPNLPCRPSPRSGDFGVLSGEKTRFPPRVVTPPLTFGCRQSPRLPRFHVGDEQWGS